MNAVSKIIASNPEAIDQRNAYHINPIFCAIANSSRPMIEYLIQKGARAAISFGCAATSDPSIFELLKQ